MSVTRIFRWTCDGCGTVEEREGYGLPRGWTWHYARQAPDRPPVVVHDCGSCKPCPVEGGKEGA